MRCNSCNVYINTNEDKCPICHNPLKGKKNSVFPTKVKKRSDEFIIKIIGFILVIASMINLFIDYKVNKTLYYSGFVIIGLSYAFTLFYIILYNRKDFFKIFYKFGYATIGYLYLLKLILNISLIYTIIIPSIIIINLLISFLLSLIIKKKYIIKYLNITLLMILISLIVYIPTYKYEFKIMLNINFLSGLTLLIYLLFFYHYEVKEKIIRFLEI